ncbi:MAG: hypothetical protein M3Q58_00565 [Bacteroidota bacterium]|nr:hypothetical protein [Bacteroidota bacterium]
MKKHYVLSLILFVLLIFSYSNHFTNGFEFDDFHTIVHNEYIADVTNIPLFFTDIKYYGTNPGNQGYNPVLTALNAIDYWFAGELNPVYFHISIFFWFIFLLVLLFFFFKNLFKLAVPEGDYSLISVILVGFFALHAANAETINYIIMRSDSFSTFCIVFAFVLYQNEKAKKYLLYLLPVVIGVMTKETVAMFGFILFFYILLFEEKCSLLDFVLLRKTKAIINAVKKAVPALLFSIGFYFLIRLIFIPKEISLAGAEAGETIRFFYTQWAVICHYLGNFILPLDLSVDPDFDLYPSILNRKVLLGLAVILTLVGISFFTSLKQNYRPISFGILWFFLALAPTSSFIPLAQIANDHRTFFPYIGLVLSLGWWLYLMSKKYRSAFESKPVLKNGMIALYFAVLLLHAYGIRQRNIVWGNSEMLWQDAAIKGPNNGRALMNYGLSLMAKGNYEETLGYFEKALTLKPYWAYIHINMGILKNAMGESERAEFFFQNAIRFQPFVPDGYYYHAIHLNSKGRGTEALEQIAKGLEVSPGHSRLLNLQASVTKDAGQDFKEVYATTLAELEKNPSVSEYINLSLFCYKNHMFIESILACEKALEIDPRSATAYNNICSSYNSMEQWKKAETACKKALEINPEFQIAKNNLQWAKTELQKLSSK